MLQLAILTAVLDAIPPNNPDSQIPTLSPNFFIKIRQTQLMILVLLSAKFCMDSVRTEYNFYPVTLEELL